MENSNDDDLVLASVVEERVGKSMPQDSAECSVNDLAGQWSLSR